MTYEEAVEIFKPGSIWVIKNPLPETSISFPNHAVHKYLGCEVKVKWVVMAYMLPSFPLRIKGNILGRIPDSITWFSPTWLEPIENSRNETFDQMYRRKMDENLRSIFG